VITEERLRELAAVRGDPLVASLYLDIDGRRFPKLKDAEPHLEALLKTARERAERHDDPVDGLIDNLDRVAARFKDGFDRSNTRGLAFFVTGELFEVVELPRPVRNQVAVNKMPALRQVELLLATYEPLLVVLVDRQRTRLFRFELGELLDRSEVVDEVQQRVDGTDDGGLMASHVQSHADEVARRHFRHAAELVFKEQQDRPAKHVAIGGPTEAVAEFEEHLHNAVRERVVARIPVGAQAPEAEIREAALAIEEQIDRDEQAAAVARLSDAVGTDHRGVTGLDDTLHAVFEKRVDTLLVSYDLEAPGWRCTECDCLAMVGSTCPMCQGTMEHVDDVVVEAIDLSIVTGATVWVCENADLDVMGRIGAVLRF